MTIITRALGRRNGGAEAVSDAAGLTVGAVDPIGIGKRREVLVEVEEILEKWPDLVRLGVC